jgi:cysteine desulfurase
MRHYLDHNATSPLLPEALEAILPFLRDGAANASSTHTEGQRARLAVEEAREEVAALAGAAPGEVVFTSGGTEADNAAIAGTALAVLERAGAGAREGPASGAGFGPDDYAVSTTFEHPAVHRALRGLEARGLRVVRIAPRPDGTMDASEVLEAAGATGRRGGATRGRALLVSVMHVNNEIGTIQPVEAIAGGCAAHGVVFHTDAVQALGRIPLAREAALASLSAHKIGGPQGVGALIVRAHAALAPILPGGGAAARAARAGLGSYAKRVGALRDRYETALPARHPGILVHGAGAPRVANTSCASFPGKDAVSLQVALDLAGVAVSTGTACASGKTAPSYVLAAIGVPEAVAKAALRVSFGARSTDADVDALLLALEAVLGTVRAAHQAEVRR